ncbi:Rsm22,putative [Babesia bigemina]|uniref:Rsm22,putative n=1 Tax=Babesia bigemina TaxID=5866 RepID=A0A061D5J7_BABBI|nr:LOW QUALITY PROTEIN: Rsm22,putative [Babesia bigemina]CDR95808.1 Rsm22,putative [Babesia bigemina]|eukprot:XP_012767994.1 LOW QUALITY PROTEIN: Rsm22,putative [Babesia bigemina]
MACKYRVQTIICRDGSIYGGYTPHIQHIGKFVICGAVQTRCIHHGFQFDRISPYKPNNTIPSNELDDVSRISIKTLPFPPLIKDKLFQLIKAAGKKKDIDASGSYIAKRLAARRCVEVPRVLPSILLDSDSANTEYFEGMKQLSDEPEFFHLKTLFQQNKLGVNEQAQIELAEAEDARHKNSTIHFSPNIAVAHTAHTFFGHYAVCLRIFNEVVTISPIINTRVQMKLRARQFKPTRIMFYNAGAGASVAAAHTIWDLNTFEDILVVEPSRNLAKICEYLIPGFKNMRFQSDVYESTDFFDCVVIPYSLTDIRGFEARTLLVKNLWNRIKVGGYMVMVEAGTPTGFRILHSIREVFISQLEKGRFHFLAPVSQQMHFACFKVIQCPHEGFCPLALTGKDWCHFSQRIYRIPHYLYQKGSIARSIDNEKYSYLVVGKSAGPRHLPAFEMGCRQKLSNEADAKNAQEKSFFWPRIVMPPLKLGRRVIMDLCSAPNNFKRIRIQVNIMSPCIMRFRCARDAMWGDLWRFPHRDQRPIARAYMPDTVRQRLIGKPKTGYKNDRAHKGNE